ncbi:F-box/WD repeat-containing protein 5 isoform X2 [Eurytemora carolleeae]|uniref:F-box/WD repeat-containing protein 5 isoform X2 n=1 Tax=Eurytemora carolleeae TaxID=1294199 RepID=UPI000C772127|nr:F-box/WD repeat-containing protein 5 isoform X2 [Eurytemora carolleeae]|eukprot:XP_023323512.1 F-box/WD repeat-containing protein 5-like isoform X2 [Eurytemora affinis]
MDWGTVHEYILEDVFMYLNPKQLCTAARVCSWWNTVAESSLLWRNIIEKDLSIKVTGLPPSVYSWRREWERIQRAGLGNKIISEHIHTTGVTHAAFSPDGDTLATCGNDARICVWKIEPGQELNLIYEESFVRFNWNQCSTVQFNPNGTSLMISGVIKANIARVRLGEIIIISMLEPDLGQIKSRINIRPFDSLGCWYNNNYVISSEHDWLTRGISVNKLWINKVNFADECEPSLACMRQLYRMYNCAGSSLRNITVCSVPRQNVYEYRKYLGSRDTDTVLAAQLYLADNHALHLIPVPPADNVPSLPEDVDNMTIKYIWEGRYIADYDENQDENQEMEKVRIEYLPEYLIDRERDHETGMDDCKKWVWEDEKLCEDDEFQWEYFTQEEEEENKEEVVVDSTSNEQRRKGEKRRREKTTGISERN